MIAVLIITILSASEILSKNSDLESRTATMYNRAMKTKIAYGLSN